MWCPRLEHFIRINFNGTLSRCGHMIAQPQFASKEEMDSSEWLAEVKSKFSRNQWPKECMRCRETESINNTSIRLNSIEVYNNRTIDNYLQVGGVLDNVCNSACQFCDENLSTKIGSLTSTNYPMFDNFENFYKLPQDRIEHLDINGGEPSASKNYKKLLKNLPSNLKTLRVNTNCSKLIPELKNIQHRGVDVTVTVSFDGIALVHDYVRWPVKWDKFVENLFDYRDFGIHNINLWTTVNALNINDMENIFKFVDENNFDHSFALLKNPKVFDIAYKNNLTLAAKSKFINSTDNRLQKLAESIAVGPDNQTDLDNFIAKQDEIRNIKFSNFIKLH